MVDRDLALSLFSDKFRRICVIFIAESVFTETSRRVNILIHSDGLVVVADYILEGQTLMTDLWTYEWEE